MPNKTLSALAVVCFVAGACASPRAGGAREAAAPAAQAPQPAPEPATGPGIYAEAQAERGRTSFRDVCAECHYSSEFRDQQFKFKWGRRTVRDLYRDIVRNMPEDDPGSLSDQEYVDIVAYILQLNGFVAGGTELPADEAALAGHSMTPPASGGTL